MCKDFKNFSLVKGALFKYQNQLKNLFYMIQTRTLIVQSLSREFDQ